MKTSTAYAQKGNEPALHQTMQKERNNPLSLSHKLSTEGGLPTTPKPFHSHTPSDPFTSFSPVLVFKEVSLRFLHKHSQSNKPTEFHHFSTEIQNISLVSHHDISSVSGCLRSSAVSSLGVWLWHFRPSLLSPDVFPLCLQKQEHYRRRLLRKLQTWCLQTHATFMTCHRFVSTGINSSVCLSSRHKHR